MFQSGLEFIQHVLHDVDDANAKLVFENKGHVLFQEGWKRNPAEIWHINAV